ncbi:MAG: 2-keto-4-pentenoate hydratase [Pseudomonadota bacterium]
MTVTANPITSDEPLSKSLDAISRRLVTARLNANALPDFPGKLPDSLEDAYAIQSASINRWPDSILGWKVGMIPEEYRSRLGAERLSGPIYKPSVFFIDTGGARSMAIYSGGFAAVEAEFVLKIGQTIEPVTREFSDDELAGLISAVHIGAEIASSPMADVNKLGPCCVVSDFGNNAGLIVGPEIPGWRSLPAESLIASVSVDGELVGKASASAIQGGLHQVLRYLINLCAVRGLTIEEGTLISSGAVTGIHEVTAASRAQVDFGVFGAFDVSFESMMPRQ